MMHGFGMMGGFSLLWLIVPLTVAAAGAATFVLLAKRRRRDIAVDERRSVDRSIAGGRPHEDESGLAARVFALARENGGELTVSEVVVETGRGPAEVEAAMDALVDGTRVTMEVDVDGRIRYEFPELRPQ